MPTAERGVHRRLRANDGMRSCSAKLLLPVVDVHAMAPREQPEERPNSMSALIETLQSLESVGEWDRHKAHDCWRDHADDVFGNEGRGD